MFHVERLNECSFEKPAVLLSAHFGLEFWGGVVLAKKVQRPVGHHTVGFVERARSMVFGVVPDAVNGDEYIAGDALS